MAVPGAHAQPPQKKKALPKAKGPDDGEDHFYVNEVPDATPYKWMKTSDSINSSFFLDMLTKAPYVGLIL